MELPNLFTATNPEVSYVLAVVLTDASLQAALVSFDHGVQKVVQRSAVRDYSDPKSCLVELDACLQQLGPESEDVNEVVFGLEPWWVGDRGIADTRKPLLKHISQELSLKPVGFVVIPEALALRVAEDDPLSSSVLLYLAETSLAVSLLKHGKVLKTEVVGRSGDTVADVTEALARFSLTPADSYLPSTITLFSHTLSEDELSVEQQNLIGNDWPAQQAFLHQPAIEILPQTMVIEAVASQGSKAVAESQGIVVQPVAPEVVSEPELEPEPQPPFNAKSFGVPISPAFMNQPTGPFEDDAETSLSDELEFTAVRDEVPAAPFYKLDALTGRFGRFFQSAGAFKSHHPFMVAGFVIGLVTTLVVASFLIKARAEAIVSITLSPKTVTKEVQLTIDPARTTSDVSQLILAGTRTTAEVSTSKSIATTGVKQVGESAKGSVSLINKTTSPKTFTAGTVLSAGTRQFTLNEEVTVASASVTKQSDDSETKVYGKATAAVTASKIGAESNLAKDTALVVASFAGDTYSATTTEAFTGGASREVRVASETDRQNLLKQVQAELLKQAEESFKQASGNGRYRLSSGKLTITSTTYSDEVGSEVESLSVEAKGSVDGVEYAAADLVPLATAVLQDQVPPSYQLSSAEPQILTQPLTATASASSSATTRLRLLANVSAATFPVIDTTQLAEMIKGQPLSQARSTLNKPEYSDVSVTIQPRFAGWFIKSVPQDPAKVMVQVQKPE